MRTYTYDSSIIFVRIQIDEHMRNEKNKIHTNRYHLVRRVVHRNLKLLHVSHMSFWL